MSTDILETYLTPESFRYGITKNPKPRGRLTCEFEMSILFMLCNHAYQVMQVGAFRGLQVRQGLRASAT